MSSLNANFYGAVTGDPVLQQEQSNFTSELADLVMRYSRYLTSSGIAIATLKTLKGGTTVVTQGSGNVILTITPNVITPNPSPNTLP
jgi:hypothetical protein